MKKRVDTLKDIHAKEKEDLNGVHTQRISALESANQALRSQLEESKNLKEVEMGGMLKAKEDALLAEKEKARKLAEEIEKLKEELKKKSEADSKSKLEANIALNNSLHAEKDIKER